MQWRRWWNGKVAHSGEDGGMVKWHTVGSGMVKWHKVGKMVEW